MNRLQMSRNLLNYARFIYNVKVIQRCTPSHCYYSTFTLDAFTSEIYERNKSKFFRCDASEMNKQLCTDTSTKNNVFTMSSTDLDDAISNLLQKNKDIQIKELILECQKHRKFISYTALKKLYRHYSSNGRPDVIVILQNYCATVDAHSYKRNGEFLHYLARAQCMKGNSEAGLIILKTIYMKYESFRSFYRIIFRELIQDSVLNRSEASLVIFKKYVLDFSELWSDHYPLLCFWHICWASTWFSDQMLAEELLETSEVLLNIVKDKATAFSIMALKDYNEDAVVRLLQTLLKYDMMTEYVAVLQVLFNYKLRNRDIRGCSEIIRNCEVLGVTLPSDQQGRYIKMLIEDKKVEPRESIAKPFKDFKLKF